MLRRGMWRPGIRRGRRGQAIVETALLFPLLCLLTLGTADLGRVFFYSIEITNAAREGALAAAIYDPVNGNASATQSAALAAARQEASDLTLSQPSGMSPANCPSGPPYGDAYYPTTPNTGYVYVCFSVGGSENDAATTGTSGQTVRVTILYNFTPITPMVENIGAGHVHVQATTTMVIQGQP